MNNNFPWYLRLVTWTKHRLMRIEKTLTMKHLKRVCPEDYQEIYNLNEKIKKSMSEMAIPKITVSTGIEPDEK